VSGRDNALRCPDAAAGRPTSRGRAEFLVMKIPKRTQLPHEIPLWVDPKKACYFVTICCAQRGFNQSAYRQIASDLFDTIKFRSEKGIWYVRLALTMPDHVHLVVWFPEIEKRMQTIVSKWKEWTAKNLKIE
jgi:hypothetical protein